MSAAISPWMLPPSVEIDERIRPGGEDIAGADDVRSAEEDDAVAVRVRLRLVVEDDRFAVEMQILRRREVFAPRQARNQRRCLLTRDRSGQAAEHVLVRDDVERLQWIGRLRGERGVPAHVIRMDVRIDDDANRPFRQLANRGHHRRRRRRQGRIDQEDTFTADLHGDVAAGARQHVHVLLDGEHFNRGAIAGRRLLRAE